MRKITPRLTAVLLAGALALGSSAAAQIADVSVEAVSAFGDITVEIVDAFGDQEWEVLGECSGFPDQEVEFVDYFGDITVEIVDAFGDQSICITNADELDNELREKLGLND